MLKNISSIAAVHLQAVDKPFVLMNAGGCFFCLHPPADDIPGRWIGMQVGKDAFAHAEKYFQGLITSVNYLEEDHEVKLYPNPTNGSVQIEVPGKLVGEVFTVVDPRGKEVTRFAASGRNQLDLSDLNPGLYILNCSSNRNVASLRFVIY